MPYEIYDRFAHLNDTPAGREALDEYAQAIEAGKSDDVAEVLASNALQRAGYNVNAKGGVSIRARNALTIKTDALNAALKRAHALVLHIDDVLPDESFALIDTASWNAVTADMQRAAPPTARAIDGV